MESEPRAVHGSEIRLGGDDEVLGLLFLLMML